MSQVRSALLFLLGAGSVAAVALAATAPVERATRAAVDPDPVARVAEGQAAAATLPTCDGAARSRTADGAARSRTAPRSDAQLRDAAQRGLTFLERSTVAWQDQHACYGCHVQAVTLKAMAVGRHHDYAVDDAALRTVVRGLTELPGGSRTAGGLRYAHGSYLSASKSLGGAAFALYDEWVATSLRDDLLQTAHELRALQAEDGAIRSDYSSPPVAIGALQDTVLAMATWNQAYARTADDAWLTAVGRAEQWLSGQVASWGSGPADLQSVNYALMGLHAARSGAGETATAQLVGWLTGAVNEDGGWSLQPGAPSDAYATGQTLYTLRTMGLTEADPVVARGTAWLAATQGEDGGWSRSGRERAEAMWAVMGLVSVDVLTLAVDGLEDGAHVEGIVPVEAIATDNEGRGVVEVELRVDDVVVHRACGDRLAFDWNTAGLSSGVHVVDLVARNADDRSARRRFTVYGGDHWLTRVGTQFEDGGTVVTFRNLAPADRPNTVRLTVHAVETVDGVEEPGEVVDTQERPGSQGPMRFFFSGRDERGEPISGDRFFARLAYLDAAGTARQTEEVLFVHDTPEAQRSRYAEVGGKLDLQGASGAATVVELLDAAGRVVSSTVTTEAGQYRFKNVQSGAYRVRVNKDGWGAREASVEAAPAAAIDDVDLSL